jgi:tetratricopeptide (TPR) repeat protein
MLLCYSTFAKILNESKPGNRNPTQKSLHIKLFSTIDKTFGEGDISDDTVSTKLLQCKYNVFPGVIEKARKIIECNDFEEFVSRFKKRVVDSNIIKGDKRIPVVLALLDVIRNDGTIADETVVEMVNSTTKKALLSQGEYVLHEFLAGVLLYTAISVKNKHKANYAETITADYIGSLPNERGIKEVPITEQFNEPQKSVKTKDEVKPRSQPDKDIIYLKDLPPTQLGNFVARDKEIVAMERLLSENHYLVLEGMGGIGKSELAKQYIQNHKHEYNAVQLVAFRDDIESTIALGLSFSNIIEKDYEDKYGTDSFIKKLFEDKLLALRDNSMRALIVIDDYKGKGINEILPEKDEYNIICTTREKSRGSVLKISAMNDNALLNLFCKYCECPISADDELIIREIIRLVLGHTMTVMLVAIALNECEISASKMLSRLQNGLNPKLRTKIEVNKEGLNNNERKAAMYCHLNNLFDMTKIQDSDNYTHIMTNMAIVPYSGLDKEVFYDWALSEFYSEDDFDDRDYTDLNDLIKMGWIQHDDVTKKVSLHPVISDVATEMLKPSCESCNDLICEMYGYVVECLCQTYIEKINGIELIDFACKRVSGESEEMAWLHETRGELAGHLAEYADAIKYCEKAVKIYENLECCSDIVGAYIMLGMFYSNQGNHNKALSYIQKAMKINEQEFDGDNTRICEIFNNFGLIYSSQGKLDEALEHFQKALNIYESQQDEDNQANISTTCINMAQIYNAQGNFPCALLFYGKALCIYDKIFDYESFQFVSIYDSMGLILIQQGELDDALGQHSKALAINEKTLGTEHPQTANSYNNIGTVYFSKGNYTEALKWYEKAIKINVKILGEEHLSTAMTYGNIAKVHLYCDDYTKAFDLQRKVVKIYEATIGKEHRDISHAYMTMGDVCFLVNEHDEAFKWYKKSLTIALREFGTNHHQTAVIYENVGVAHLSKGNFSKGFEYCQKAVKINENVFGTNHLQTADTYQKMGGYYLEFKKNYKMSLKYFQKALPIYQELLEENHPVIIHLSEKIDSVNNRLNKEDECSQ